MRSVARSTTGNRLSTNLRFGLPISAYHAGKISEPFLSDIDGELVLESGEIQRYKYDHVLDISSGHK